MAEPDAEVALRLPHRGPALLIVSVLEADPSRARCRARVPARSPFRSRGPDGDVVPTFLALEMGAQAAASSEGREGEPGGDGPPPGFVVALAEARFHELEMPADLEYDVEVRLERAAPPLRVWRVRVSGGGRVFAEGCVSTYA